MDIRLEIDNCSALGRRFYQVAKAPCKFHVLRQLVQRLWEGGGKPGSGDFKQVRFIPQRGEREIRMATTNPEGKSKEAEAVKEGTIKGEEVIWLFRLTSGGQRRWIFKATWVGAGIFKVETLPAIRNERDE